MFLVVFYFVFPSFSAGLCFVCLSLWISGRIEHVEENVKEREELTKFFNIFQEMMNLNMIWKCWWIFGMKTWKIEKSLKSHGMSKVEPRLGGETEPLFWRRTTSRGMAREGRGMVHVELWPASFKNWILGFYKAKKREERGRTDLGSGFCLKAEGLEYSIYMFFFNFLMLSLIFVVISIMIMN